jgi:hypothetical protein
MTTSGSYDFSVKRDELIKASLRVLGVIATGESLTPDEINDASQALNIMLKAWQNNDIGLWLNKEAVLYLEYQEDAYSLGPTADHCTLSSVETEVATAAATGDATITVDSATGISNADKIGIQLDDGTLQWTTVNGAPVGNVITLTAVTTDTVAVDNVVYAYTTKAQRPLDIIEARLRNHSNIDTPLYLGSRREYMNLSDKTTDGVPTQLFYDRQLATGVLYTWPRCNDVQQRIRMTLKYPIQDMDALNNDFDFPQEWYRALKFNLAVEVAPEFGIEASQTVQNNAVISLYEAAGWDREQGSVFFGLDRRR